MLLLINKQPGANVIETVNRIKALLPHMQTQIPASIQIKQIVDRTTTIAASVHDVEFTLLLTIALVVMVIFLFLRNLWATLIPGVTVPLALFGTAALMYVLGYSLDNLSLMGLTIAVGFVVDDAIVMLENIYRHIEAGMSPREAALKGSGEIGFTIISISLSLVAVFIPLAADGRHHRPPVPRIRDHGHHDHRGVGVRLPDTLAHDVRACFSGMRNTPSTARCTWRSSGASTSCSRATRTVSISCSAIRSRRS